LRAYNFFLRYNTYILLTITLAFSIFAWSFYSEYADLKIAYRGFSAFDWITIRDNPYIENIGYPAGLHTYYKSLFMYIYLFANDYLGISADVMVMVVQYIEILLIFVSIYIFIHTLFKDVEKLTKNLMIFLLFLYFVSSFALFSEISRFTSPYIEGLYYNFADALRLVAIALMLNKNYKSSSLVLGISFIIHPLYGIIGALFLFAVLLSNLSSFKKRDYRDISIGMAIFFIFAIGWYILFFPSHIDVKSIPLDEFVHYALLGNVHWFPVDFGIFKDANHDKLIGFLGITLLYLYILLNKREIKSIDRDIFFGLAMLFVVLIVGLLFSYYRLSKTMIKLALARSSLLFMEIAIIYIVYTIITSLFSGKNSIWRDSIFLLFLVTPFLFNSPYPLLMVLIYLIVDIYNIKSVEFDKFRVAVATIATLFTLMVVGLLIYFYINGYIDINYIDRYISDYIVIYLFLAISIVLYIDKKLFKKDAFIKYIAIIIISLTLSVNWLDSHKKFDAGYVEKMQDYKTLQLWVSKNTPKESLFMIDPTISYGWRGYSKRASWGSLREWIAVWLYNDDYEDYLEGKRRLDEFGIDSYDDRYRVDTYMKHYWKFITDVRDKFYSVDRVWFDTLASKYGIDYIVMEKIHMPKRLAYPIPYENKRYILYKIDK